MLKLPESQTGQGNARGVPGPKTSDYTPPVSLTFPWRRWQEVEALGSGATFEALHKIAVTPMSREVVYDALAPETRRAMCNGLRRQLEEERR